MSSPEPPTVAAVILNYRTPGLVGDCLASLEPERAAVPGLRAVVVDNASGDGSAVAIRRRIDEAGWNDWVALVESPINGGFSAGNNVGIAAAEADFFLLLNSDTLIRPGAIAELLRALESRPDVGLIGPRLDWADGTPQQSCFRWFTPLTGLVNGAQTGPISKLLAAHDVPMPVQEAPMEPQWICFACVLIRRSALEQVGPLDPGYFMYYEDVDYCRRLWQAGWKVLYWPAARVVHLHGQSGPVERSATERKRRPGYYYAARNRYYTKFYGRSGLWLTNVLWGLGRAIARPRELLGHKRPHTCSREAIDNWINWLDPMAPPPLPEPGRR